MREPGKETTEKISSGVRKSQRLASKTTVAKEPEFNWIILWDNVYSRASSKQ